MNVRSMLFALIITAPISAVSAQEKAPALPDLSEIQAALRASVPPATAAGKAVGPAQAADTPRACPVPSLDGGEVQGRMFSTTYDVRGRSGDLGTIETSGKGRVFKDTSGGTIAQSDEKAEGEWRTITVRDCGGERVGVIVENDAPWGGNRAFTLKDASGAVIGATETVGYLQSEFTIKGAGGSIATIKDNHWFLDRWAIKSNVDGRLVALALIANSAANSRESSERRRERMHDRPGRGDR